MLSRGMITGGLCEVMIDWIEFIILSAWYQLCEAPRLRLLLLLLLLLLLHHLLLLLLKSKIGDGI